MLRMGWLGLLMLLSSAGCPALAPETVRDPRPASWVLDEAGLLSEETEHYINDFAQSLRRDSTRELLVVTLHSADGIEPRSHATRVYNHLGISSPPAHEGVLIWIASGDRAAELVLGSGLDTPATREIADQIMQQQIVPAMRAGDPDRAVRDGVREAAQRLLGQPLAEAEPGSAGLVQELQPTDSPAATVPAHTAASDGSPADAGAEETGSGLNTAATGAAGGGLLLGGLTWWRRWKRYRARSCPACRAPMERLSEERDDAHLSASERAEEKLRSVDYDVWACSACSEVQKLRYGAIFTRYARCPRCQACTKSSTSTTLVSATYDHGGRVRVDERCEHCGFHASREHSTPRRTRSSSSSGGSRGSSGGGRSSGGGASGRW